MLKLKQKFDLHRDVVSDILRKEASVCRVKEYSGAVDTRILNIERDGGILYSWKLLYTFDKQVCVSSCSLNKEETLLAVSLAQNTRGEERLKPISKCLTLLIEIHPINNTKVLKAVDCRVKVQFLHAETDRRSVLESHLLLLTEDGYVDLYHVMLTKQEGYRVDKFLMRCVQFYPNHNCETMLEFPLEFPANLFRTVNFVNLGFDHYHEKSPEQEPLRMKVFTNIIGSMSVCYSQHLKAKQEVIYTVLLVHKDCSKTFRVSLGSEQKATHLHPLFIPIGYHILVYLQDHFLHCINTRQQEISADVTVLHSEEESSGSVLDLGSGRIHEAELSPAFLLKILRAPSRCPSSKTDPQRMAALHCLLVYLGNDPNLELKITEWLFDNVNAFDSFDQIQEFILASLYRISYEKSLSLDKVLPYSSVLDKKRAERRPSSHMNHIEENTKKVLSMVDTWCLDKKLVPLFQEEDHQHRALIGLLELIRHMLESAWLKFKLGPRVLCFKQQGSPGEWSVFHFMFRILEATRGLCLPLPPGYHTLLAVFAVRCLPQPTFLQYVDHGFLQLTETFVSRLMTDLDNSDANERLKFSILKRLPEPMEQRIYHMWDHPVSSAWISRDYVRTQLEKLNKSKGFAFSGRDKLGFRPEFLPLTYLAKILSDIEEQAPNPFEEQENVDARFVEETALKQTLILLGFEGK
ncbi:hypothetical protein F7725_021983 [Dissostichus mawsoni]|uniref:Gamma-secretase-activating protein C-terminal domain-containing protein n=1 Tax=Dissostichus mawsoni TaxID=36200 RepID=A0A7J5ZCP0_DISMA|nr:hypothetical protein F7725_021983 [Dissostichus mawsoni]